MSRNLYANDDPATPLSTTSLLPGEQRTPAGVQATFAQSPTGPRSQMSSLLLVRLPSIKYLPSFGLNALSFLLSDAKTETPYSRVGSSGASIAPSISDKVSPGLSSRRTVRPTVDLLFLSASSSSPSHPTHVHGVLKSRKDFPSRMTTCIIQIPAETEKWMREGQFAPVVDWQTWAVWYAFHFIACHCLR